MKFLIAIVMAFICLGCEPTSDENGIQKLPSGLFSTQSLVQVSNVDSQGLLTGWIDTATFYVRISENGKWEQYQAKDDTCVYWRMVSDYLFGNDTVYLNNNHGISYKIESKGCQEIMGEYDRDTTIKIPIKRHSNQFIEIVGQELYTEKIFKYIRIE
jgi:hypothetical protein